MSGHNGFVACVCAIPPNEEHPQGLIATGSNDSTINIYSIDSPSPIHKLEGHTNTGIITQNHHSLLYYIIRYQGLLPTFSLLPCGW